MEIGDHEQSIRIFSDAVSTRWNAPWANSSGTARTDIAYDIYRAACVKEFEIVLEQSGKLLRKRLCAYFASNRQADRLVFKDLFQHAVKHDLIDPDTCERWLKYRDNRSDTAHDYGEGFAETTLKLLPDFIADAKALADVIEEADG